jgi:predicted transcriptional regulator
MKKSGRKKGSLKGHVFSVAWTLKLSPTLAESVQKKVIEKETTRTAFIREALAHYLVFLGE